jgi:hypothetical protein
VQPRQQHVRDRCGVHSLIPGCEDVRCFCKGCPDIASPPGTFQLLPRYNLLTPSCSQPLACSLPTYGLYSSRQHPLRPGSHTRTPAGGHTAATLTIQACKRRVFFAARRQYMAAYHDGKDSLGALPVSTPLRPLPAGIGVVWRTAASGLQRGGFQPSPGKDGECC